MIPTIKNPVDSAKALSSQQKVLANTPMHSGASDLDTTASGKDGNHESSLGSALLGKRFLR